MAEAGDPPDPLLRWADGLRVRLEGADGIVDRPEADPLRWPGAGSRLLTLGRLLTTPRPVSWLRARLVSENGADPDDDLIGQLRAARVLVPWELGNQLAQLHLGTTSPSSWPVVDAAEETGRLLRENSGVGIDLPQPAAPGITLAEALARRRSARAFTGAMLDMVSLSTVLGLAAGVSGPPGPLAPGGPPGPRRYPSGGGLYPIEILVAASRCEAVPSGVYRYLALAHSLVRRAQIPSPGDLRHLFNDHPVDGAAAFILLCADLSRPSLGKYGLKAYRLMTMEAGHIAQNVLLMAAAFGLPALPLCGFLDAALATVCGLYFPHEVVLYAVALGGAAPDVG